MPNTYASPLIDYYSHGISQRHRAMMRQHIDHQFVRRSLRFYNNGSSPESDKWKRILYKTPMNLERVYKKRLMNKVLMMWLKQVGWNRYRVAMLNYRDFYQLSSLPDFQNIRRSSAGIIGWTHAGPFKR